jgi:hypothetical protein
MQKFIPSLARAAALCTCLFASQASAQDVQLYNLSTYYSFGNDDQLYVGLVDFFGTEFVMAYDARDRARCSAYFVMASSGPQRWGLVESQSFRLGAGNDRLHVIGANDTTTIGGDGAYACASLPRMKPLVYNGYNVAVYGGDGDDTIEGGDGVDVLFGGNGDDSISGGAVSFGLLSGDAGHDYMSSGSASHYSYGGTGNDVLWSSGGATDSLFGGDDKDCLHDDRATRVDCGSGQDAYNTSRSSRPGFVSSNCEVLLDNHILCRAGLF